MQHIMDIYIYYNFDSYYSHFYSVRWKLKYPFTPLIL